MQSWEARSSRQVSLFFLYMRVYGKDVTTSLKSLIETKFATTSSADPSSTPNYNCWSCRKTLTNNAKIFVLNPCGHAICQTCVDTLAKPSGQCPGCDTKVKTYIELKREGTGYASGGQVEIKRFGTAFQ